MVEIRHLGVLSVAKISGIIYLIIGIILGLFLALFSIADPGSMGMTPLFSGALGLVIAVFLAVVYGIIGFVFGAIFAWIYNVVAGWFGGIKMDLKE